MMMTQGSMESAIGPLTIVTNEREQVCAIEIGSRASHLPTKLLELYRLVKLVRGEVPTSVVQALQCYFAGDLAAIDSIEVATPGTALQRKVWDALRKIPAGTTTTYGELAQSLGYTDPRAAIEIGAANGANPIAIVVPCHRVIAKNGHLRGYAWGLRRKAWLLEHEGFLCKETVISQETARLWGF